MRTRLTVLAIAATATAVAGSTTAASTAAPRPAVTYDSLAAAFNNVGISDNGNMAAGNLDGGGNSLSAQDLAAYGWSPGRAITVYNAPFHWPNVAAGSNDNVVAGGQVIKVSGRGSALEFVETANNGPITSSGTITYTDGTTQPYTTSVPDWYAGVDAPKAIALPHWNTPNGQGSGSIKIYPELVPLNQAKTVASVTLPNVSNGVAAGVPALHVFALGFVPRNTGWTGTWGASTETVWGVGPWTQETLRMVVHDSTAGSSVRIRLENSFTTVPATIGHATVAVQGNGGAATSTPVTLTFGGKQSVTMPAGGEATSDSARLSVPANTNLLVSLYFPGPTTVAPVHSFGNTTSYVTATGAGDHSGDTAGTAYTGTFGFWTFLSDVEVVPTSTPGTIIALGDSITDGVGSAGDANHRWPNLLANRLDSQHVVPAYGVVDEGISGNKIVTDQYAGGGVSAIDRLDRDVLDQPDARTLILFEGINDIKAGTPADQVIAGIQQIAAQAHAFGLRVLVATIAPFKGFSAYTPQYEAARQTVNSYLRTTADIDHYLDFDQVLRDPSDPQQLRPAYDCGDHLHPNDAGYQAVATSIDLAVL